MQSMPVRILLKRMLAYVLLGLPTIIRVLLFSLSGRRRDPLVRPTAPIASFVDLVSGSNAHGACNQGYNGTGVFAVSYIAN